MNVLTRAERRAAENKTGTLWWLGQIASWLAFFLVLALIAVMIVVPRLTGSTAYTVLTGSMRPSLPPGTLIVVKSLEPEDIRIGDVMTYQLESGESEVVTHRVVGIGATTDGEQRFTLRGDANNTDDEPVIAQQIRGSLWYSVPYLGYVNSALSGEQRIWLTRVAVGGLLAYALVMLLGAWRDKKAKEGP
ncbi:signal peptidase I [Glutamicibacter ardleyensis]|uniref:signal peptidase I n=1 Tax=Glutamicibacter ardleyensis TaxID=225894 RepID=UPI003F8EBAE0